MPSTVQWAGPCRATGLVACRLVVRSAQSIATCPLLFTHKKDITTSTFPHYTSKRQNWFHKTEHGYITSTHLSSTLNPYRGVRAASTALDDDLRSASVIEDGGNNKERHVITKTRRKATRPPPSSYLIQALRLTGNEHALPFMVINKTKRLENRGRYFIPRNLSFTNPRPKWSSKSKRSKWSSKHKRPKWSSKNQSPIPLDWENADLSLSYILARYILRSLNVSRPDNQDGACSGSLGNEDEILSRKEVSYLEERGYSFGDLDAWMSVIIANDLSSALIRLEQKDLSSSNSSPHLPLFLVMFVLRRGDIHARSLRFLLSHAEQYVESRTPRPPTNAEAASSGSAFGSSTISEPTMITLVARLLRHARKIWPEAITAITAMLTNNFHSPINATKSLEPVRSSYLTFIYNKILKLLSIPTSRHPIRSASLLAKCQFSILGRMAEFSPPLLITREGYRAVVLTQLGQPKTEQEKDWASLKAKSWPPWRQSRTNFDEEKGIEYGLSRAGRVIRQMQQAGYSVGVWEKIANIYAGWDTDGSPTIQTRTFKSSLTIKARTPKKVFQSRTSKKSHSEIWAARIEATRTVQEAWACFLSYKDSGTQPSQRVYSAMLRKILFDARMKARRRDGIEKGPIHPGDGFEVLEAPISPHEATYVRVPPPSSSQLFNEMIQNGLKPSGWYLAFHIRNADTFEFGVQCLREGLKDQQLFALLSTTPASLEALLLVPDAIFDAYISLLGRYSKSGRKLPLEGSLKDACDNLWFLQTRHNPLIHIIILVLNRKRVHIPTWNSLLDALAKIYDGFSPLANFNGVALPHIEVQAILAWEVAKHAISSMRRYDTKTFQSACIIFENAAVASKTILDGLAPTQANNHHDEYKSRLTTFVSDKAEQILLTKDELTFLRQMFLSFSVKDSQLRNSPLRHLENILRNSSSYAVPPLLEIPEPAHLHAYVRALGEAKDFEGILSLVHWMVNHKDDIATRIEEQPDGAFKRFRRCLIAVRVYLERSWEDASEESAASEELILLAEDMIDGVEEWNGWPSHLEVSAYISNGRVAALRKEP